MTLLLALTLDDLEVVVDLEVVAAATTVLGSAFVPMAIILSLVIVCTSLPIMRIEASSPSW
ncbi:hypothetical protein D3C76_1759440 [compost metagenome]